LDAGRGQVYCQFSFDTVLERRNTPFLSSVGELAKVLDGLVRIGNGGQLALCGKLAGEVADMIAGPVKIIETLDSPPIAMIAQIGAEREETESRPEPLYIRKPDAKPQTGFAVDRSG
jgi:tRNA A37 threonylcarbamoyladenosine modification protein TsaB